jgi:hypothetical protein
VQCWFAPFLHVSRLPASPKKFLSVQRLGCVCSAVSASHRRRDGWSVGHETVSRSKSIRREAISTSPRTPFHFPQDFQAFIKSRHCRHVKWRDCHSKLFGGLLLNVQAPCLYGVTACLLSQCWFSFVCNVVIVVGLVLVLSVFFFLSHTTPLAGCGGRRFYLEAHSIWAFLVARSRRSIRSHQMLARKVLELALHMSVQSVGVDTD